MNKLSLFSLSLLVLLSLCAHDLMERDNKPSPIREITAWYQQSLVETKSDFDRLLHTINHGSDDQIVAQYRRSRVTYKKCEFLLLFLNAAEVTSFINAPPLPKVMHDVDRLAIMEPTGLQYIDELMVELQKNGAKEKISRELQQLLYHFEQLITYQKHTKLTDRTIIESMRFGLVYIATLSITGFDTPGTLHGLQDASSALKQMEWCVYRYFPLLPDEHSAQIGYVKQLFKTGQQLLQTTSFNDFDRYALTKEVLNPLSTELLAIQNALHIEFADEVESLPIAVNTRAKHLYASNFLNEKYFKTTQAYKDSTALHLLGNTLFYDPILSTNNQRACVSCHLPEKAFAEGRARSITFDGTTTLERNSMSLVNAVYAKDFFYDLRASDLRTQFEHVLLNTKEFNTSYSELEQKLNACGEYQVLFENAFTLKNKKIKKEHVQVALAMYVGSLSSFNSPFDRMMRKEIKTEVEVAKGYNLFMGKAQCGTCHFPPTFAGLRPPFYDESESEVLGVTATEELEHPVLDNDLGRINNGKPKDQVDFLRHSFKTVTVRNVALTAPYFHNGAFSSLEQVLTFYNKGGGAGLGLDVPHQTLGSDSLALTSTEINQLITFLNALTDVKQLPASPSHLPKCQEVGLSKRTLGGQY